MTKQNDIIVECVEKIERRVHKTLAKLDPEFCTPLISSVQIAIEKIAAEIKGNRRPAPKRK